MERGSHIVERAGHVWFGVFLCPSSHLEITGCGWSPAARPFPFAEALRDLLQRHRPVPQRLEHFGDLAGHRLSSSLLPESISTGRPPSTELSQCNQASRCGLICSNVLRLRLPHSGSAWAAMTSAGTNLPPWPWSAP